MSFGQGVRRQLQTALISAHLFPSMLSYPDVGVLTFLLHLTGDLIELPKSKNHIKIKVFHGLGTHTHCQERIRASFHMRAVGKKYLKTYAGFQWLRHLLLSHRTQFQFPDPHGSWNPPETPVSETLMSSGVIPTQIPVPCALT